MNEKRKKKEKGKSGGHPPGDISTKNDKFVKKNLQRVPVQRPEEEQKVSNAHDSSKEEEENNGNCSNCNSTVPWYGTNWYQVVIVVIGILQQFSLYYYYRMRLNF